MATTYTDKELHDGIYIETSKDRFKNIKNYSCVESADKVWVVQYRTSYDIWGSWNGDRDLIMQVDGFFDNIVCREVQCSSCIYHVVIGLHSGCEAPDNVGYKSIHVKRDNYHVFRFDRETGKQTLTGEVVSLSKDAVIPYQISRSTAEIVVQLAKITEESPHEKEKTTKRSNEAY